MARAIVAVIAGLVSAFIVILVIELLGAMIVPAGVAPSLKDEEAMRAYLMTLPLSAYAFVIASYLFGSAAGGIVTARTVGNRASRAVWIVGGLLLAVTIANLVRIPHPLWFSIVAVAAIFIGTLFATRIGPRIATPSITP
jgi:hypothetical protein